MISNAVAIEGLPHHWLTTSNRRRVEKNISATRLRQHYDVGMRLNLPFIRCLTTLVLLLHIFVDAIKPALSANSNGWIQKRIDGSKGKFTILVTDQDCLARAEDAGWAVALTPPNHNLVIYSDTRKNYYLLSAGTKVRHTSGLSLIKAISTSAAALNWQLAYKTKYQGHPVDVWRATRNGAPISKSPSAKFDGFEFWAASDVLIPQAIVNLNIDAHGWPDTRALPLRYMEVSVHDQPRLLLTTISLERANIPASKFLVPKNYTRAKSELEVATSTANLGDLMDDWQEMPRALTDKVPRRK